MLCKTDMMLVTILFSISTCVKYRLKYLARIKFIIMSSAFGSILFFHLYVKIIIYCKI